MFAAGHRTRAPSSSWDERWTALWRALPVIVLPLFIIGSIYFGLVTPTETGAVAVAYLLLLGFLRRQLSVQKVARAALNGALTSAMLLMIFGTGSVFARYSGSFRCRSELPISLATFMAAHCWSSPASSSPT